MVLHAAILPLITGANGIATLFEKGLGIAEKIREMRRKERKAQLEEQAFENSLAIAPPRIRAEYDKDFRILGPTFEKGDGVQPKFSPFCFRNPLTCADVA